MGQLVSLYSSCHEWHASTSYPPPESIELEPDTCIEFLTDVEGNWDYFLHFVSRSKVLDWHGPDRGVWGPGVLVLRKGGMLVFGGDATDKGPGDIRFTKSLLSLKACNPDRVFIVLGNRDINKLRFYAELAAGEEGRFLPYWDKRAKPYKQYLQDVSLEDNPVNHLRWMLDGMGCQVTTFGTRMHELALLRPDRTVCDEDVRRSYYDSVDPYGTDPWTLALLRAGHLAVVLGDALFVHGGLSNKSVGRVPGQENVYNTVLEWVSALNAWKDDEIAAYVSQPGWQGSGAQRSRGAERLIEYGTPADRDDMSIVYHNPFDDGNPKQSSDVVERFLLDSGIRRVFSGHQPHGESPTVVRQDRTGLHQSSLLFLTCDTSRSDAAAFKLLNTADYRGRAVSIVRTQGPYVEIEGVLKDGAAHGCKLHIDPLHDELPDALVGRQLVNGSWVKTVLADEDRNHVLAVFGKGFDLLVETMHVRRACHLLAEEYAQPKQRFAVPVKSLSGKCLRIISEESGFGALDPDNIHMRTTAVADMLNQRPFNLANYDTYMFSCNGVIWSCHDPTNEGRSAEDLERAAIALVNKLIGMEKRVLFVTNDSRASSRATVERLLRIGIKLCGNDEESKQNAQRNVITTASTCARHLKATGCKRPFVICSHTGIIEELKSVGITNYVATIEDDGTEKDDYLKQVTNENVSKLIAQLRDVDAVVMGWDQHLTALKIAVAATYLKWNHDIWADDPSKLIPLVTCSCDNGGVVGVTGPDYLPESNFQNRQVLAVGNGTMAQTVCRLFHNLEPIDVGKPSHMFCHFLRSPQHDGGYGVDPSSAVMIGNSLATDIVMANRLGAHSLLVLTGQAGRSDLEDITSISCVPTWIVDTLEEVERVESPLHSWNIAQLIALSDM